jgi:putative flavoprotein involved in K+ transport
VETSRGGHKTWLAGRDTGEIPFRPERFLGRNLLMPLVLGFVFHHVLTVKTPPGRKARPRVLKKGGPLIRVKRRDLAAAGVERVPRVVGARGGQPLLETGQTLAVNNVIWCSGYHPGFDWIDLPVFGDDGELRHQSGMVESQVGLYFVGLPFLHAMSSSMIHGVGRDAARLVNAIRSRLDNASVARAAVSCL